MRTRTGKGCLWTALALLVIVATASAFLIFQARRPLKGTPEYVALGSSFAAGAGLGPLQNGSPLVCARSVNGYPQQLARMTGMSIVDMSCGGATTEHVLNGGQFFQGPQLRAISRNTRLVTITVGGNDIGYIGDLSLLASRRSNSLWGSLVRHFWSGPSRNRDYATLERRLITVLQNIGQRAPNAKVVLATYPTVLPPSGTCARLRLSAEEAANMREVAQHLAATTRAAANKERALLIDMNALGSAHNACSDHPWTRGWTNGGIAPFHPTLDGARATATAIAAALRLSPAGVSAVDEHDTAGHEARRVGSKK